MSSKHSLLNSLVSGQVDDDVTVGSTKLRTGANTSVKKNIGVFLKNGRMANWAACAAMLMAGGTIPAI